ncbi:hypothetical protein Tco_0880964 [Tanacetum coccineum]
MLTDLVHVQVFSTHDEEERQDEEDKEEEGSDLRVQTPFYYEPTNDEESDDVIQGGNDEGEKLNEEETNEEEEVNELYRDQSSSVSSGFISNMLNPNPDTGIDSILNLNTKSTSLRDVPASLRLLKYLLHCSLQNLPTFDSVFKFEDRVKALEVDFYEIKQTNQFADAVSSKFLSIVLATTLAEQDI